MNIVIIGGGSAGTTCAFELRKLNKDLSITILEKSNNLEYSPCALPYVISGEIPSFENIFIFEKENYEMNNITLESEANVTHINRETKEVNYVQGGIEKSIAYDYLVLATGSTSYMPSIKGLETTAYNTLKTIEDAKNIVAHAKEGLKSVVIGGGLIGVELAMALNRKKEEVTLIEAKNNIFSSILDTTLSTKIRDHIKNNNIEVYEGATIREITSNKIIMFDKEILFDKLFICTGMKAELELAKKADLLTNNELEVDIYLLTTDKNIYACGDCILSTELISEKKIFSQLGTTAVRQAKLIAKNIISQTKTAFPPVLNNTVTKIGDLFVASVGLTKTRCEELGITTVSSSYTGTARSEYYPSQSKITIQLVCLEKGQIIGGQIIGNEEVVGRINTIALAIQKNCHVKELAALETCYNPASAPIFDPITIVADICMKKISFLEQRDNK